VREPIRLKNLDPGTLTSEAPDPGLSLSRGEKFSVAESEIGSRNQ